MMADDCAKFHEKRFDFWQRSIQRHIRLLNHSAAK